MKFNEDTLLHYMNKAPLALAFERALECKIYPNFPFPRPILDLGCGEGLFAHILFGEKIDTGVDPNPRELEHARKLQVYEELIPCKGDSIPKPDGSYKTIFSNSVLEHIPDVEPVLREVYRLLAPGGRFYFTVPSPLFCRYTVLNQLFTLIGLEDLAARFRRFYNYFWKHYHDYPLEVWEGLVKRAGFEVMTSLSYDPRKIALLNDLFSPFAFFAYLSKRFTNRWIIIPYLRQLFMYPLYCPAKMFLHGGDKTDKGGLIFVAARKEQA